MFSEKEIKALLIDWLFDKGMINDAVIINEMVVANWSRRADIAVANGRLYGFEIKSHFDTLKRLPGQVESFQAHFDKVVVVAATKFIASIQRDYPSEIGILEVYEVSGRAKIRQVRPGRICEVKDVSKLTSLITKSELEKFLKQSGIPVRAGMLRSELVSACGTRVSKPLRSYVLDCIKQRYNGSFRNFLSERRACTTEACLELLSKSATIRVNLERQFAMYSEGHHPARRAEKKIDFSILGDGIEALGLEMPQSVLIRRKTQKSKSSKSSSSD
ncbi:sce7726 family protein [Pseudomonas fragariae (ex Marin et al. 2024)]|uniref:sce7726 family protein n=1 Tax=Pseudomonas TaxID=286 RepID=UPI00044E1783|nr:sce7726 family protein [Pseudomonas syringae]AKF46323.1 hypothetical protein PsyrB_14200 [Pseudomonas syringae pv. syringae B301D]EXL31162.1 hypothetical protein PssB301D_02455 [Pseudomonas syringae pv. syringae str. B301D-R]